jgi:hypothetical protein
VGVEVTDHDVPFHRIARVAVSLSLSPTATQLVADVHVTARSCACVTAGSPVMTLQLVPFHRSINAPLKRFVHPTAKHTELVGQATPARDESVAPDGFGDGTLLQEAPFQRSIRVRNCEFADCG